MIYLFRYIYYRYLLGGIILRLEDKLMKRIEQGDAYAVDELIKIYYSDILRYCLWHLPDRCIAEDATQEIFLKMIRYYDRYVHKGKFKSFLYKIATNTCIDIKRNNLCTDVSLEDLAVEPFYLDKEFEITQSEIILNQLVRSLPKDLQEIVILRFGQDLTIREIAKVLDIPLRTAQSKLRSALKKLKKTLKEGGTL